MQGVDRLKAEKDCSSIQLFNHDPPTDISNIETYIFRVLLKRMKS